MPNECIKYYRALQKGSLQSLEKMRGCSETTENVPFGME